MAPALRHQKQINCLSSEEATLNPGEIEHIARDLLRQFALPSMLRGVSVEAAGVWYDARVSPHHVLESLKRGLAIVD